MGAPGRIEQTESVSYPVHALAALVAASAIVAGCGSATEPTLESMPTTFEGQPESLTTVPDDDGTTTTAAPTTIPAVEPTGVTASDLCTGAALVEPTPEIDTDLLPETSGVVYSRTVPDRLYAHNDSGNLPRLYGIGATSSVDFVWSIDAALLDWEDIAVAGSTLYFADTGDNLHIRPTVRLVAAPEPVGDATIDELSVWSFTYAEGRLDTEALIVDVDGGEAVFITKGIDFPAGIYRLPLGEPPGDVLVLDRAADYDIGESISAADLSADGRVIAVRSPSRILLYDRPDGSTIVDALAGTPCETASAPERQGEAIGLHPDGRGYTTLSERESATRNDFRLAE